MQRIREPLDALVIDAGDIGMHVRRVGRNLQLAGDDFSLLPFQLVHPRFHRRLIHAVLDGRDYPGNGLLDLVQRPAVLLSFCPARTIEAVHFLGESPDSFLDSTARDQPVPEAGQHAFLDLFAGDGPVVVAGAAPVMIEAAITVAHDETVFAVAAATGQQAGKKGNGPLLLMELAGLCLPDAIDGRLEPDGNILLPRANRVPELIIHNAQMRNLGSDPCSFRVDARHAPAGGRVFHEPQPVPDQHARVKLVIDDAGAARDMTANAGITPCPTKRAGNAIAVQIDGDGLGAFTGCKLAKNA